MATILIWTKVIQTIDYTRTQAPITLANLNLHQMSFTLHNKIMPDHTVQFAIIAQIPMSLKQLEILHGSGVLYYCSWRESVAGFHSFVMPAKKIKLDAQNAMWRKLSSESYLYSNQIQIIYLFIILASFIYFYTETIFFLYINLPIFLIK